jgi:hypothetical protein
MMKSVAWNVFIASSGDWMRKAQLIVVLRSRPKPRTRGGLRGLVSICHKHQVDCVVYHVD